MIGFKGKAKGCTRRIAIPIKSMTRLAAVLLLLNAFPPVLRVHAGVITVGCSADELIAAIETANADPAPDTLELAADCTYDLETSNNHGSHGDNGLPQITSGITIIGSGSAIQRSTAKDTPLFRLFQVNAGATLSLTGVALRNGIDALSSDDEKGGAVINHGTLHVAGCTFSNNQAGCGGAIWTDGVLKVSDTLFEANIGDN